MSDVSKIVIEITKSGARVESISINGSKTVKTVAIADLASTFTKSAVLDSGLLPTKDGIAYYGQHSDKEVVVYTSPPTIKTLTFSEMMFSEREQKKYRVPIPRAYFFVSLEPNPQNGTKKIVNANMYASSEIIRSKLDHLKKFPFCNVYPGGKICWGRNTLSPIRDLYGVQYYFDLFWSSPFNGDLEPRAVPKFAYNPNTGEVVEDGSKKVGDTKSYFKWADLAKAEEFDNSALVDAGSFHEAVSCLLGE